MPTADPQASARHSGRPGRERAATRDEEGICRSLSTEPTQSFLGGGESPLGQALGRDSVRRYEAALLRLRPRDRRAVRGRIEQNQSYRTLAAALGVTTPGGARAVVTRALGRLIEAMST